MNLVSLLILPAIIRLQDNDGARFSIAAAALVVLIGAITFSSRKTELDRRDGLSHRTAPHSVLVVLALFDIEGLARAAAGIVLIALIVFAESGLLIGFFLPGDSLLFIAGFLSSDAASSATTCRRCPSRPASIFVAAVLGDQVGYLFGRKVGPSLFDRPQSRLFNPTTSSRAHAFFDKHGPKTIVLARFVPIVRTFAPIVAGVGQMQLPHVRHLQPDRRLRCGASASPRSATSSARSTSSRTTSRSPAVVIVAISADPDRDRVHAPPQGSRRRRVLPSVLRLIWAPSRDRTCSEMHRWVHQSSAIGGTRWLN